MKFVNYKHREEIDLFQTVSEQKLHHAPNLKVHIGTDSVVSGEWISYFTVVAFRHSRTGVHFIFSKEKVQRFRNENGKPDSFTRLWRECKLTMDVAQMLVDRGLLSKPEIIIELDYNNLIKTVSTPLISSTKGWAVGEGYQCLVKYKENAQRPDQWEEQIAVKAANHLCLGV